MKNRFAVLAILLLPLLFPACGKKEAATPTPPPPDQAGQVASENPAAMESAAPKILPPCPGYLSIADVRGDVQQGSAALYSDQPASVLVGFYTGHLAAEGWLLGASVVQDGDQHLQFSRNGQLLRLQIGPAPDSSSTRVQVAWQQPAEATEFGEAHSPEPDEEEPEPGSQGSVEW